MNFHKQNDIDTILVSKCQNKIYVEYLNNKLVGNDMKIGESLINYSIILVHKRWERWYNPIPVFSGQTSIYTLRPR